MESNFTTGAVVLVDTILLVQKSIGRSTDYLKLIGNLTSAINIELAGTTCLPVSESWLDTSFAAALLGGGRS
jgi:hypothetical protein